MKAIEYLKSLPRSWVPRQPSNSELVRWLNSGAIIINDKKPKVVEEITFPIRQLIYFHNNKRVTVLRDRRYKLNGGNLDKE